MSRFEAEVYVIPLEQRPELRRGRLKNGNPSGDYMKAPRCGAQNRQGEPCQCPAMRGKRRCRLHGGKSTGPKTKEGVQHIRQAHWIHGFRSKEWKRYKRKREAELLAEMTGGLDLKPDPATDKIRKRFGMRGPVLKVQVIGIHNGKTYT